MFLFKRVAINPKGSLGESNGMILDAFFIINICCSFGKKRAETSLVSTISTESLRKHSRYA